MRNLKKIIALVAVFAMLVSSVAFAADFSDVAETDNYAKAIDVLSDLGIVQGDDQDGDGVMDFRPEDTITRAEVTALIARIQNMDTDAKVDTDFSDVDATHWASGYIAQAASQGIVNGYPEGDFKPENPVAYEEIVKMLMVTLGYEPFAVDAGGYPAGYITAASRYGVLDGVVGGGVGVEAPRGMVAQMIYNAIDTPLMDTVTYGSEKEYGIYDGVNYPLMTLLNRDLKLVKFTGVVNKNSLNGAIDTTAKKTVTVAPFNNAENVSYIGKNGVMNKEYTLYQGDVDCDPFMGFAVEVYAKKTSNFDNNYTVVAMSKQAVNSEVEFALDQYDSYLNGTVKYLRDVNGTSTISKIIDRDATVIYNGISVDTNEDAVAALDNYFGKLITKDSDYSGKVTLLDMNEDPKMDVVNIEIVVTGVVKEVTGRGQVRFLKAPVVPFINEKGELKKETVELKFDEENTATIINLTKNGEAIDYTELKKWDVVSVIWNGKDFVYNVEVLDEGSYVDGAVTVAKSNNDVVLSDGNTYEIAADAYGIDAKNPGFVSGRFYIDAYGKIVALDDTVEIQGVNTKVDQYAYVLAAKVVPGNWDGENIVQVKLLDMSGEVYEAELASKVKLYNFDQTLTSLVGTDGAGKPYFTADMNDTDSIPNLTKFAEGLVNRVIAYEGNDAGQVKTIAVEAAYGSERDMAMINKAEKTETLYNADAMTFKNGVTVNEDTTVFFIAKDKNDVVYGSKDYAADEEGSSVGSIGSLIDGEKYFVYGFAPDVNDDAQVVVLMNADGMNDPSINIAVVESKGSTVVNGTDVVWSVNYYQDGELKTANTKVDMATEGVIKAANRGDLVQLTVDNGVITYAKPVLSFKAADCVGNAAATTPEFALGEFKNDEEYYFGAVVGFSSNGAAKVQPLKSYDEKAGKIELDGDEIFVREGDANVYVYDVNMKPDYRLDLGSLADANYDDVLFGAEDLVVGKDTIKTPAYGMADYVFVRMYNNKVADIVVYNNYEYDYSIAD